MEQLSIPAFGPQKKDVIKDNLRYLRRLRRLVDLTEDAGVDAYTEEIGRHVQHIIGFYEVFFRNYFRKKFGRRILSFLGLSKRISTFSVDYETRDRDENLLDNIEHARERLYNIIDTLHVFSRRDLRKKLKFRRKKDRYGSTVGRELDMLGEHTVHHIALLKYPLQDQGVPFPEGFDKARSTEEYESGLAA